MTPLTLTIDDLQFLLASRSKIQAVPALIPKRELQTPFKGNDRLERFHPRLMSAIVQLRWLDGKANG